MDRSRLYTPDPPRMVAGPNSRTSLAQLLAYTGRANEAITLLDIPAGQLAEHLVWDVVGQAIRFGLTGDREHARTFLTPELQADAKTDMLFSWLLADCYALMDEPEQALKWLANAVAGGFLNRAFFSEHDPWLAALRRLTWVFPDEPCARVNP